MAAEPSNDLSAERLSPDPEAAAHVESPLGQSFFGHKSVADAFLRASQPGSAGVPAPRLPMDLDVLMAKLHAEVEHAKEERLSAVIEQHTRPLREALEEQRRATDEQRATAEAADQRNRRLTLALIVLTGAIVVLTAVLVLSALSQ